MALPLISYVIITRNRKDELFECLENLDKQNYPEKQVVVVDNGSTTYQTTEITKRFPEIKLIASAHNLGVGGGRNAGVRNTAGEICIFLDDDARFNDSQASRNIVRFFQQNPNLACVALRIQNPATGEDELKAIPRRDKKSLPHDYPCAYFCGAGFALRREVFNKVGLFWEEFGYSGEELDLSYRLIDDGYELHYAQSIVVLHRDSPVARPPGQWIYYNARNRCWLASRHLPWHYVFTMTLMWWFITAWQGLQSKQAAYFMRGIRDAIMGIQIPLHERKRLKRTTISKIKRLSGRLWY